jgi:26S proteasome non-ATPase regulatory subunit 9
MSPLPSLPTTSTAAAPAPALLPFAVVDEVSLESPASTAGLQVGDLVAAFGDVRGAAGQDTLVRVGQVLKDNEGRTVEATVLRHGRVITVSLKPAQWSGRGLLGCHLRPL